MAIAQFVVTPTACCQFVELEANEGFHSGKPPGSALIRRFCPAESGIQD